MGLSASTAVRLFSITRKSSIELEQSRISNQKRMLARDMQNVSRIYQQALSSTKLKWSNNSGITYNDITYSNLMSPSSMNKNKCYLLTDASGKVVLDEKYKEYAMKFSPDGKPGANWESCREEILASVTGIPLEKIKSLGTTQEGIFNGEELINDLINNEPINPTHPAPIDIILARLGDGTGASGSKFKNSENWQEAYYSNDTISLGTADVADNNLKVLLDTLAKNLGKYFDDPEKMLDAADTVYLSNESLLQKTGVEVSAGGISVSAIDGCTIRVRALVDQLMGAYAFNNPNQSCGCDTAVPVYNWNDVDSSEYQNYLKEHETWQVEYDAAMADYKSSISTNNTLLTAEEEQMLNFYDTLFSSIAEKGWILNDEVQDPEYLNEMLQNNFYTITDVERSSKYNSEKGEIDWINDYDTDIASNKMNIFKVNDADVREVALVEYEMKKRHISDKETRLDLRMQDLETELAAINQIIESAANVANDNTERTLKLWG